MPSRTQNIDLVSLEIPAADLDRFEDLMACFGSAPDTLNSHLSRMLIKAIGRLAAEVHVERQHPETCSSPGCDEKLRPDAEWLDWRCRRHGSRSWVRAESAEALLTAMSAPVPNSPQSMRAESKQAFLIHECGFTPRG